MGSGWSPTRAHPLCPAGLGLLVLAPLGSKLTASDSGPGFGCSRRLPPAQFLPPDSASRDGAGLIPRTRGAPDLGLPGLCKG